MIGTTISHYRILEQLGVGSLGRCYKAWDLEFKRVVALALLPAQCLGGEKDRRRLDRELAAVAALDHPNICHLYEFGDTEDGGHFVVAAFCDGEALADRIARGPLKPAVAVDLARRIAAGLAQAHERGIVHGCLGPHCIVVADDGQPKILDLGAHALAEQTCHDSGALRVDRGYKAPEQLRGEAADTRSDLWALGAILYEMVTGKRPTALAPPVPVSVLRPEAAELEPVVSRALALRKDDRYANAEEMRRALRSLHSSESSADAPAGSPPPAIRSVGPYRLLEHLGGGGMGIVYRAEDVRLGRCVALKLLPPELSRDPLSKARFMQEARMASALDHPNLCTIYDVGETEEGQLFLSMPCYEGETLRERLERGPLPISEIVDIGCQIACGLAQAHQKGIVHRDIKPANLMITTRGVVKILDFGIAKLAGQTTLTRVGAVVGTPAYMAPEQMRGDPVDARTDLWALGVVLYEMAAGRRPFLGDYEAAVRYAILNNEPEPLSRARPEAEPLDPIVADLVAKKPENRSASAEKMAHDLKGLAAKQMGPPRVWLALAAAFALIVAGAIGLYRSNSLPFSVSAPAHASAERRSAVAVLGFRDLSGSAATQWLGPALAEMLGTELAAGSGVRVISGDEVVRAQRTLALPVVDTLDSSSLAKLRNLLGADRIVIGSYLSLPGDEGRRIRLDLRVLRLPEGETQAAVAEVGSETELFDLVARTGKDLRHSLGFSEVSEEEEKEARAARPASVEAMRLYTEGLTHLRSFHPAEARDLLQNATRLEPGSAVIHSALSKAWSDLGYDGRAVEEARKAVNLSAALPREQRLAIKARFFGASKSWVKASEIYRSLWTFYPDNLEYGLSLASALSQAGRTTEAMTTIADLRKLPEPDSSDPRIDLEEAATARSISDRPTLERAAKAAEDKARVSGESLVLAQALLLEGTIPLFYGRPAESLPQFREARELYIRSGYRWGVARATAHICLALYRSGDFTAAEPPCLEATSISESIGNVTGIVLGSENLGSFYIQWGDLTRARSYLNQAELPLAEIEDMGAKVQFYYTSSVLDLLEGNLGSAQKMLEGVMMDSRQSRNRVDEARSLAILGMVLALQGKLFDARENQDKALQILKEIEDPIFAAPVLFDSTEVLTRLGNISDARRRTEQGLTELRESGSRLGIAKVLKAAVRISLQRGDIASARAQVEEQLRVARSTGSRILIAEALQNLGRLALAENDPAAARKALEESQQEFEKSGDRLHQMEVRMDLALLSLIQKNPVDAERLTRELAAWYGSRGIQRGEAQALSVLGEALAEQGQVIEARKVVGKAGRKIEMSEDQTLRFEVTTRLARIEVVTGRPTVSAGSLESVIDKASQAGFETAALEARLVLGQIQRKSGMSAAAVSTLHLVREEARGRGLKLIARQAGLLLEAKPKIAAPSERMP